MSNQIDDADMAAAVLESQHYLDTIQNLDAQIRKLQSQLVRLAEIQEELGDSNREFVDRFGRDPGVRRAVTALLKASKAALDREKAGLR